MKVFSAALLLCTVILITAISCKAIARTAAKYWTRKQIREFVSNCEIRSSRLIGEENATKYCNCAVDVVAQKYRDYQETKTISLVNLLEIAEGCK
ncbi:MAG: hypothetical protein K2Q24_17395 [Chitinophagaceae bacterium]|nr:hypothetical protein [Chitinophagaceae bacterium]